MRFTDKLKNLFLGAIGSPEKRDELVNIEEKDKSKINQLLIAYNSLLSKLNNDATTQFGNYGDGEEACPTPIDGEPLEHENVDKTPPALTGVDLYIFCKGVFDACLAQYNIDTSNFDIAACNTAGWEAGIDPYIAANTQSGTTFRASCSNQGGTLQDWFCGMDSTNGYPASNDGDCTGGL